MKELIVRGGHGQETVYIDLLVRCILGAHAKSMSFVLSEGLHTQSWIIPVYNVQPFIYTLQSEF